MASDLIKERLEYLRSQIEAERISYAEIAELQDLRDHIDSGDVQLLEWAGVREHPDEEAPPMTFEEALEVLISAAGHWADELVEWIAPASEQFEDEESAEGQYDEADEIARAIALIRKELDNA